MPTTEIPNGVSYTPDHRGYQPRTAAPEWRAPDVYAPALKVDGTVVEQAHAAIVHARDEHQKHLAATDAIREHFTDEGYRARLDAFRSTSAAKEVDRALENVTARRDAAAANVDKVRKSLSPNTDTSGELRASRYLQRVIRTLDGKDGGALFESANQLISSATREELGTLLQELPAYLQSRGSTTDWIDAAVAQVVPEFATARAQLKQAESAFQVVRTNVQFVRQAFASDRPATILVDPSKYDPDVA
jgi:vacuolar-type H+-ATPase subunit E/Vma4